MIAATLLALASTTHTAGQTHTLHWTECVRAPGIQKHCWHFAIKHPKGRIAGRTKRCVKTGPVTICVTYPRYAAPPSRGVTRPTARFVPLARPADLGWYRVTCYQLSGTTASGAPVGWGVLASNLFPFGTHLSIPALGVWGTVLDHIDGLTDIDVWRPSCWGFPTGTYQVAQG